MQFALVIPWKAQGKGRPRWTGDRMITPEKTRDFEQVIRQYYALKGGPLFPGSVKMRVDCTFEPSKGISKRAREALMGKWYSHKPDADNALKAIMDALNGVAYVDDARVVGVAVTKRYGESDAIMITIEGVDA